MWIFIILMLLLIYASRSYINPNIQRFRSKWPLQLILVKTYLNCVHQRWWPLRHLYLDLCWGKLYSKHLNKSYDFVCEKSLQVLVKWVSCAQSFVGLCTYLPICWSTSPLNGTNINPRVCQSSYEIKFRLFNPLAFVLETVMLLWLLVIKIHYGERTDLCFRFT